MLLALWICVLSNIFISSDEWLCMSPMSPIENKQFNDGQLNEKQKRIALLSSIIFILSWNRINGL